MSDPRQQAYVVSVVRALRESMKGGFERTPLWIRECLEALYTRVPATVPFDLLALRGVGITADYANDRFVVSVGAMLERGWGLDQSVMVYKNLRLAHPRLRYAPAVYRTFSRAQLRDEFGTTYGNIIADCCSQAFAQPVFSALLFGELDLPVPRAFVSTGFNFDVDGKLAKLLDETGAFPSGMYMQFDGLSTAEIEKNGHAHTPFEAETLYNRLTGATLSSSDNINPRSFDYDLAAIRAALRQAGGDLYPYDQESYEG